MSTPTATNSLRADRLRYLVTALEGDIARGKYHGAVICLGRHGEIGLHQAVGYGYREQQHPLKKDSIFSLFSLTKAFTNVLVFRAIERGELAFTDGL
jgi:CubicO group peptidase (beta-lactamase class C family)